MLRTNPQDGKQTGIIYQIMYRRNLAIRRECFFWKHNESGLSRMSLLVPFGAFVDGEMMLNKNGEIVESVWNDLPNHYVHVELDCHIIMPNYIHGIIIIVGAGLKPAPTDTEKTHGLPEIICGLKRFSVRRINHAIPPAQNHGNVIIMNTLCAMETN